MSLDDACDVHLRNCAEQNAKIAASMARLEAQRLGLDGEGIDEAGHHAYDGEMIRHGFRREYVKHGRESPDDFRAADFHANLISRSVSLDKTPREVYDAEMRRSGYYEDWV